MRGRRHRLTRQRESRHGSLGRRRPWTLVEADDASRTLGEGRRSDWTTLRTAIGAFIRSDAAVKTIVYDDDVTARHLTPTEDDYLRRRCAAAGLDVEDVGE